MTCPTLERLAEYCAESLPPQPRARLDEHLAGCARCRRELAALRETQRLLEAVTPPAMPAELWAGVAARIQAKPRRALAGWWKAAAGFGVAAVLIAGAFLSHRHVPALPVADAAMASYVADHQFLSAADPFADRAGLGVMLAAQGETR